MVFVCLAGGLFGRPAAEARALREPGDLAGLEAALQEAVDRWGFDVAVAVTDLQTGETVGVRIDEPRLTGCTINLLVLIQATLDMQNGLLLEEDIDWMIATTIYWSDATLARELLFMIGGGDLAEGIARVAELARGLGLDSAVYDHPPAFEEESLNLVENTITPRDMNLLLSKLWHGEILDPQWTAYLLRHMTEVSPGLRYLLERGTSYEAVVHHKNGFYGTEEGGYVDNDVGIVSFTVDGTVYAYAISYFGSNVMGEFADASLGQELSAIAWSFFAERHGLALP